MAWWSFGESLGGLDTLGARGCGIVQRGHWRAKTDWRRRKRPADLSS
jgi:hypothetical protein